jgi:hypothetical protein
MMVIPNHVRVVVVVMVSALAAGLLTLALLAKPAQARAATFTSNDRIEVRQGFLSCPAPGVPSELVIFEGTLHTLGHTTVDANGVFHAKVLRHFQGQAEGSTSGDKYVLNDVFTSHFNDSFVPGENFNVTTVDTTRLIRQGSISPTDDLTIRFISHITINANGEVTTEVVKAESECT